jgi:Na+-transporting NADH:ubiquinone oxidoreductase subunit C
VPAEALSSHKPRLLALSNDDPRKIILIAFTLCLVCSVVVSITAVGLRPLQERNAALALKAEILRVAGYPILGVDIEQAFADNIETQLIDLETGLENQSLVASSYSYRDAARDPNASSALGADDIAGIRRRPQVMPVYFAYDQGALKTIIIPVYGYGLWSTMYGLLALAPDGRTAQALSFYEQRETAGLGGEVANPTWTAQWVGKTLIDDQGQPIIQVIKGQVDTSSPAADHQIDGLSGATLTANGVNHLMTFWLGDDGFGPFLDRVRQGDFAP